MKRALAMTAAILTAIVLLHAQDAAPDETAPRKLDRQQGKKLYDLRFADRRKKVDATAGKDDDVALAEEHLRDVAKFAEYPSLALVVCEQAFALGMRHRNGYATAATAAEVLLADFPERKADALKKVFRAYEAQYRTGADRGTAGARLIDLYVAAADEAAGRDDFRAAFQMLIKAYPIASALKSPRKDELLALRRYYQARRDLQKKPSDLKLRAEAIRLAVSELDQPAAAATLLVGDLDERTRTYVPLAAKPTAEVKEAACLELGNWYLELSKKATTTGKAVCLTRATAYLTRYLALHEAKDEPRIQAELLLDKAQKQLAAARTALAPKTEPTPKPKVSESKWIDVLKLVDAKKHAVSGSWKRQGSELSHTGYAPGDFQRAGRARIAVPFSCTGSYEMEVRFSRANRSRDQMGVILPVGTSQVALVLAVNLGDHHGLSNIGGQPAQSNGTAVRPGTLARGKGHVVRIQVLVTDDQAEIAVELNGQKLIRWAGSISSLSLGKGHALPQESFPGLIGGLTTFHRFRLRKLQNAPNGAQAVVGTPLKPGAWTDVLKLVDLKKHVVEGEWREEGDELYSPFTQAPGVRNPRIMIPAFPERSYELEVQFQRRENSRKIVVVLPAGRSTAAVVLAAGTHTDKTHQLVELRGGKDVTVPGTHLSDGKSHTLYARVLLRGTSASIRVRLDDKEILLWEGRQSDLQLPPSYALKRTGGFGLCAWGTVFHSVRVR